MILLKSQIYLLCFATVLRKERTPFFSSFKIGLEEDLDIFVVDWSSGLKQKSEGFIYFYPLNDFKIIKTKYEISKGTFNELLQCLSYRQQEDNFYLFKVKPSYVLSSSITLLFEHIASINFNSKVTLRDLHTDVLPMKILIADYLITYYHVQCGLDFRLVHLL